jgi:hypothetical protein
LASYENVVVWPPLGASPIDDRSRADYYDSMFHSAAVVGINTSALIEAGIVGRSVHTVLDPEFAETQEGTLHFHYLVHANGGLLRVARDFEEHLSQLSATLRATEAPDHKRLSFLEAFVRPHGLDTPATPILVDAVERLHAAGPFRVKRQPLWLLPLRSMLWLVGLWLRGREAVRGARAAVTGQRLRAVGGASTSEGRSRLSILFVMKHPGYVRNFESVLRLLAGRGHQIHLAFQKEQRENQQVLGQTKLIEMLCRQYANVSRGPAPGPDAGIWSAPREALRRAVNYLRYLEPRYRESPRLRERAELRAPRLVRRLSNWPPLRTGWGVWLLSRALPLLEQAIPPSRGVEVFLRERQPDIVVITPLVELGASQADLVRAARRLGIRSGLCVHSWDNLTNKGLMPDVPDIVTVWNEAQKREAVELHRVPADRVVVTGAVSYDHWFDWSPSRGRREFCQHVGLRADRPFLLYVCSSPFIAADEASFVRQWVSKIRTRAGARLGDVGVLIRPHPQNAAQWLEVGLSDLPEVAIWPRAGADPVTAEAKADYYDSIYHCAAVVGVNTSALIEAAIVGRPVYTLLAPEFRDSQEGTLHFHHLLRESDGLLRVARSYDEHAAQLAEAVMGNQSGHERDRRFLEAFIRPSGLGIAAGPRLVAAIEAACARPAPRPSCPPLWASALRVSLTPVVRKLYAQRCEQAHHRSPPPPLVTQRAEPERSEADRLGVRLTAGHGQER